MTVIDVELGAAPVVAVTLDTVSVDVTVVGSVVVAVTLSAGTGGTPGPGFDTFEFTQASPSTVWDIVHNLGRYPQVSVVVDGFEVDVDIEHISDDELHVISSVAIAGTAYLL